MTEFSRVGVIIIDGVGVGEEESRRRQYPKDEGVNSLVRASRVRPLDVPVMQSMGLERVPGLEDLQVVQRIQKPIIGAYGALTPTAEGNGSPEGHLALMGYEVTEPYMLFDQEGFPPEVVRLVETTIESVIGKKIEVIRYPGTDDISGVTFINHPHIGAAHLASGSELGPLKVPIYASTDSVLQIALHQSVVPQDQIERIGKAVREALNTHNIRVARVIMRPFVGEPGNFQRVSGDRRDYAVDPDGTTLIDVLKSDTDVNILGVGKAPSMLNNRGFDRQNIQKLNTDQERMEAVIAHLLTLNQGTSFSFINLIGTDELWGHTRKPEKYIEHIEMIDAFLARAIVAMTDKDLLIITSDHGNDPSHTAHTNHTNERTPLLVYSPRMKRAADLGVRSSFTDVAMTVADNFGVARLLNTGKSFLQKILQSTN